MVGCTPTPAMQHDLPARDEIKTNLDTTVLRLPATSNLTSYQESCHAPGQHRARCHVFGDNGCLENGGGVLCAQKGERLEAVHAASNLRLMGHREENDCVRAPYLHIFEVNHNVVVFGDNTDHLQFSFLCPQSVDGVHPKVTVILNTATDDKNPAFDHACEGMELGQSDSIPALVNPSGDMAARHRKGVTAERLLLLVEVVQLNAINSVFIALAYASTDDSSKSEKESCNRISSRRLIETKKYVRFIKRFPGGPVIKPYVIDSEGKDPEYKTNGCIETADSNVRIKSRSSVKCLRVTINEKQTQTSDVVLDLEQPAYLLRMETCFVFTNTIQRQLRFSDTGKKRRHPTYRCHAPQDLNVWESKPIDTAELLYMKYTQIDGATNHKDHPEQGQINAVVQPGSRKMKYYYNCTYKLHIINWFSSHRNMKSYFNTTRFIYQHWKVSRQNDDTRKTSYAPNPFCLDVDIHLSPKHPYRIMGWFKTRTTSFRTIMDNTPMLNIDTSQPKFIRRSCRKGNKRDRRWTWCESTMNTLHLEALIQTGCGLIKFATDTD
ncbi:hypothetical protein CLF_106068 [Clonorchis sinensis]|uniref:Uncharacterized protein n=1 Tax=Clonorchis sinensis TaxID=79923 RepID=G7YPM4_CLOSI|nr:hypothetical protein CLF_106068 [Clonorchis sinensis]